MEKQFVILYTHQKQKKAKTWHDGVLKHSGTGTKAVLYDEKGCRLDSIHMKVEDIKLGEQLESDRYYILVEEVKAQGSNAQTETISNQSGSAQNTTQPSIPRARCPGLKRKKSGFMPPRLVKQACLENSPNSEILSGLPSAGTATAPLFHNNAGTGTRVPFLPHQSHNIGNSNVQITENDSEKNSLFQNNSADNSHRNVFNLYSRYSKLGNTSGSNNSSQELSSNGGNQRLLSPWSVYGSKNSSPSLNIGNSLSKSMFGSQGSDHSAYSYEDTNKLLDKFVDDKVDKSYLTENTVTKQSNSLHGMNCSSNKPQFCNDILHPKEAPYKMEEDCIVMNNKETGQSKRNISQIMNLLKKKPLVENNLESSLTHSVKIVEEQPVKQYKFRETTQDVKLSNTYADKSINVIDQKDHQQNCKSENSLNEVKTDNEVQHLSDEVQDSDKVLETSNDVSGNNVRSNKDIPNKECKKQTLSPGEKSLLETNEESDNDDELIGSFHINFSPLSHVTNTDDENEVNDYTSKEKNDFNIDCDSGQIEEKYDENVTDKVDSVDYDGCATNEKDGDSLEHCKDDILYDTGNLKNGQNRNMKRNTASVCEALRKPNINKESPIIDTGTENCVLKGLEKTKDILHDMDMENKVLEQDEEKQNIVSERKAEKAVNDNDTKCSENFDTFEEGTDFKKTDVNSLDTFVSNECDMKENSDKDTFQAKVKKSKLGNLSDNVRVSLDAGKQVLDNNNDNFEGDNIMKDICDNDCYGADIVDDAELANQSVDNNASQYSRTTSQDTMDFSCDTLDSDDPNYHGIQTQHLGRLVPSSGFSKGLTVDDLQKGTKSWSRFNTTTENENMNCSPAHKVNSMSMYGNKIGNSGTSSGAFHQHKEPRAVSILNNALRCQNSNQFDRRKNSWSDTHSRNISPDTVKLTAPTLITGVEDLDSEDPLGNTHDVPAPPHPSKLIQRHIKRKADVCDTLQNRQSEEINKLNHDAHSMDSQFGGYGTHGISSAVVSRQHLNHPEDRACSSQYNAVYHTPGESPSLNEDLNQYRSPFQQLSDSDLSFQSSPNFYIDWQNNKPQICQQGKVCDAESTIDVNEAPVDTSTRGMTERSSPLITDEDEIYGKLYKPRMMYQHQFSNTQYEPSNTSESSEESSPALIQEENMASLLSKCKHKDLPDSVNSSLDSFPYQHYETLKEGSKANKSPNWQQHSTTTNPPHSQLSDSCDGYLFQGQRKKLPASLEPAKDGNSLAVSEDSMKHTPNGNDVLNSKWQNFVASQTSDDCDIVMNKLTKTVDTTRKERKDFVSLKSSPGLYNTQKAFFQPIMDIEKYQKSDQQSLVSGLNSQLSDFSDDISEREVPNCQIEDSRLNVTKSEHIPNNIGNKIQAVHKKSQDIAQTNDEKLNVVDMDKEIQEEFDSEMFSSMDSIADDDFYMDQFTESAKNKNLESKVGVQEVPEIKENNLGDENLTSGKQVCDSSNVYSMKETETEGEVSAEIVGHPGSNMTSVDDNEREVTAVECVPTENELCAELDCEEEDLEEENKDLEKINGISEESENVKDLKSSGSERKLSGKNAVGKGKDLNNLVEINVNKLTMVTENTTKEETNCSSPSFSLDESLDLSFSLDIACATSTQPDRQISKTPAMRIGWRPPIKSGNLKSPNQSDSHAETVPQHSDAKKSEKLRPTFKCLRLITQKRNSVGAEQKSNNVDKTFDKVPEKKCELFNPDQSPNIFSDGKQQFDPKEKNLSTTVRSSINNGTKNTIYQQQRRQTVDMPNNISSNKSFKPPSMLRTPVVNRKTSSPCLPVTGQQGSGVSQTELRFPGRLETERLQTVFRQVVIPDTFSTVAIYKQVLTAALTEYINTQLLDVARRYHHALLKVDTTGYSEYKTKNSTGAVNNPNPHCQCGVPSKMICVKKEGPNCGRYFYTCSANRNQQCKFFQWADEMRKGGGMSGNKRKIQDSQSLRLYMKDQHVHFYGECQLIKRTKENINRYFKAPKWARNRGDGDMVQKKQMFLKLPYKGRSSLYAKDDIWVISKHLDFDPVQSFLARSTYYGPSSSLEVEIEPLALYSPSNWQHEVVCHAILVGNLSSELSCMDNIRDHIQAQSPPVLSHLLNRQTVNTTDSIRNSSRGFQAPRIVGDQVNRSGKNLHICSEQMDDLCRQYIDRYSLNRDQAEAMRRVSNMFSVEKSAIVDSVLLIHGVFGAGKSFLLSVMVLFLVKVFHLNDSLTDGQPFPWKLLISSTTNVAVDRILMGLLDLGFEDFVRVGSVKKIAKPVLPYSVHASGTDNQELKDLQEMLRSGELTATEKSHVRQSIEKHRRGENKKKLGRVRVVGATCASCSLACLNNMEFPLVLLDECSQMTEPASLLPIARFACQKLLLVGDPKQLDPTIQGTDAAHQNGLEQTMFDRLIKMGSVPTLLRTQYRCHPYISAVANNLFYGGMLEDGISQTQRKPLLEILPTICYYDVERGVECCEAAGSYYNEREAQFVVFLLQVLLSSGIEPSAIGVITLYKSQMARISDLLTGQGDCTDMKGVQVSTVDAFQGGERDVIILSTVRSHACGFIDNDKRTNVALTRARHHLLIVGNLNNLSKNVLWGKVINHCKEYENGVQSADEARHSLEKYLENLKSCETSQNSTSSKSNSQNSTARETITRKRKPRRKRKLSDGHIDNNSTSSLTNEPSPCSSSNSSKRPKNGAKQSEISDIDSVMDNVDFDEDLVEEINMQSLDAAECDSSTIPTHGDEHPLTETTGNCQSRKQQRKRRKHQDKLKTLTFDSDQEHTDVDNDDDLPTFSFD